MDQLLVITSYPTHGNIHSKLTVGIASYAKNTILGIKENYKDLKIKILAEKLEGENDYTEDGVEVKRVWKRNSNLSFYHLFLASRKYKGKHVMIEFEVSMFGNPIITSPLPFFIWLLRITGKNVTIVMHQAISDLNKFEGHTNITGLKSKFVNFAIQVFYKLILLFSNNVIIFEESLKELLPKSNKITVIPHGVQIFDKKITKEDARKKLKIGDDKKVVMIFGYIAWYKGTDWLVEEFKKLQKDPEFKDYVLIIGGGPNPNHLIKQFYTDYFNEIKSKATENIIYSGFIEESEIQDYYACSDLIILPYRVFMSASGPLSLAYSFKRPAVVSTNLKSIFNTQDIKKSIEKHSLKEEDLSFDLNTESLKRILKNIENKSIMEKVANVSNDLANSRSFKEIGKKYFEVISK